MAIEQDVLIGAIEGGTGYWAEVLAYDWKAGTACIRVTDDGGADPHTGQSHEIDAGVIRRGIDRIAEGGLVNRQITGIVRMAKTYPEAAALDIDAEVADCVVQAAIFGRIIYG